MTDVRSIPGVAHVERFQGAHAADGTPPTLAVEVPHGADRTRHYDALAARLQSPLPDGLVDFFHVNTDVGAWDLGRAIAAAYLRGRPRESVLLVRCLVPRTFVDCNRVLGDEAALSHGGLTPGLQPWVTHPDDQAMLRQMHRAYVDLVDAVAADVVGRGGHLVSPHTYAPRTVGIDTVDDRIVENLHRVYAPDLEETWPLRPEVDLITADGEGDRLSPDRVTDAVAAALSAQGRQVVENGTYWLHPATRAAQLSARHPGRVLCFELRRDLAVKAWTPFAEMRPDHTQLAPVGQAVGAALAAAGQPPRG